MAKALTRFDRAPAFTILVRIATAAEGVVESPVPEAISFGVSISAAEGEPVTRLAILSGFVVLVCLVAGISQCCRGKRRSGWSEDNVFWVWTAISRCSRAGRKQKNGLAVLRDACLSRPGRLLV